MDALRILGKDLRQRVRDRPALLVALIAPLVLTLIASFSLGRLTRSFEARYALVDRDGGGAASRLVAGIENDDRLRNVVTVDRLASAAEAKRLTAAGRYGAAFVVPEGFTARARQGQPVAVEVVGSPEHPLARSFAEAVAEAFSVQISADQLAAATAAAVPGSTPSPPADELAARAERLRVPVDLDDVALRERGSDASAAYFGPSMAIVLLLVVVQLEARSLLAERSGGTLRRMLASGVRPWAVLGAKTTLSVLLGLASMAVTLVAVSLVTGARWGNPAWLAAVSLATVLAFTGLGSLLTVVARTEEVAISLGLVVGIVLALIGGNFVPLSQAPAALRSLGLFTPNGWALRGFSELTTGAASATALMTSVTVLFLFGVTSGTCALTLARRSLVR